jgi:hypothetical protein
MSQNVVQAMDGVKHRLLESQCPDLPSSDIHSGYHRGRRPLLGDIFYPDIISIHHLHLHVIVRPYLFGWIFRYPVWLSLMWKSDAQVLREIQELAKKNP